MPPCLLRTSSTFSSLRLRSGAAALLFVAAANARAEGLLDALVERFSMSEIQVLRAKSNAPFLPLAWATVSGYSDAQLRRSDGSDAKQVVDQSALSEGAFLPIPFGRRDALVVGEWMSKNELRFEGAASDTRDVFSLAIPVGWARQTPGQWQIAGFVAPLGHESESTWYWETLGGLFARQIRSDRFAWIVGAYFDVSPAEDFYIPYLGATWILNARWTISAVMPWPGVSYAPNANTFFRLGVAPSGASWSVDVGNEQPRISLSAWNLGISAQRRIADQIWLGAEAGYSGLSGLSIVGGEWQGLDTRLSGAGYALLTISFRPAPPVAEARGE
jgi:hypothetical protein